MHMHKAALFALVLVCFTAAACTLPAALPTPTLRVLATPTLLPPSPAPASPTAAIATATSPTFPTVQAATQSAGTQVVVPQVIGTQVPSATFCADAKVTTLINNFKSALQTSNGATLASLISPTHGMEARLYRNGRVVTYDQQHAKFLFETNYAVDWGPAPGSGIETQGPFHETILPALLDVFNKQYTLTCNQIQVGGTTYQATWPYTGINFYSVYYPGTQANGNMDWHTWLLGVQYVNAQPYIYAIMQYQWEP